MLVFGMRIDPRQHRIELMLLLVLPVVIAGVMFDAVLALVIVPNTDWAVVAYEAVVDVAAKVAKDELTDLEEETVNNELEAFIAKDELIA